MANRFWSPTANANWASANVWATTEGGDPTGIATPTSSDDVFFTSANNFNCAIAATANCRALSFTGGTGYTGTLSGTSQLNCSGSIAFSAGMNPTYTGLISLLNTSGTQTITSNGLALKCRFRRNSAGGTTQLADNLDLENTNAGTLEYINGTFDANGKKVTLRGAAGITGAFTLYDFDRIGTAVKTNIFTLTNANLTVTNNLTITGNSAINRTLVTSNTIGTARTITCNGTVTVTNADFRDITGAGTGSWNLSAISGGSGDCGGNSGITFTSASTQDCSAGTTWSTATWTSRVPIPQDSATFSGSSRTITQDMPRIGSVDFTGSSGLTWTTSTACSVFGSINLTDLATLTASAQQYDLMGRGSHTITNAGKTWAKVFNVNAIGGTYQMQDAFITTTRLTVTAGALDLNDQNSTIGNSFTVTSNTLTKSVLMGSGTMELNTSSATNPFTINATTGLTFNAETSTIKLTNTLGADRTFGGNSVTFYNVWFSQSGAFSMIASGSNTFNDFKIDAGRSVKFTNSTTQTVTTFTPLGTAGNLVTIRNSSSTTKATLAKAGGGVISADYVDIDYIIGSPADTWYMGLNSTDGGNNTNIYFTAPPAGGINIPVALSHYRRRTA